MDGRDFNTFTDFVDEVIKLQPMQVYGFHSFPRITPKGMVLEFGVGQRHTVSNS